jgi:hypothetical protein
MSFVKNMRSKLGVAGELIQFFGQNKRWWLLPMIALLLVLGGLIVLAQTSALTPFIYSLF